MTKLELLPHQRQAVNKLSNGKVLVGDVGTGKSLTAVAYYMEHEAPRDVYIITTAKKRDSLDWQEDFLKYRVDFKTNWHDQGNIVVDSWNNIEKYAEVKDAFFIFDEQRLVGSGTWVKRFLRIAKSNRWILLSATPGDTWLDYIPVFVANGFYKNRTQFKQDHVVYNTYAKFPKVDHYVGEAKLLRLRSKILVQMPYKRHTVRHIHNIETAFNANVLEQVTEKRWNVFTKEPLKDVADLFRVARRVVNSDQSRLNAVRSLMEKHPKLIVFYNFDYELEELRTLGIPAAKERYWTGVDSKSSSDGSSTTGSGTTSSTSGSSSEDPSLSSSLSTTEPKAFEFSRTQSQLSRTTQSSRMGASETTSPRGFPRTATGSLSCTQAGKGGTSTSYPLETSRAVGGSTEGLEGRSGTRKTHRSERSDEWATSTITERSTSERHGSPRASFDGIDTTSSPESGTAQIPSPKIDLTGSGTTKGDGLTSSMRSRSGEGPTPVAEWNGHKHEEIPKGDRWLYLVQYTAGSEGWNCIETDAMCFYSLTYSYKVWHQAHGRIDRLNTPFVNLHYYVLQSKSWIDLAIRKALRNKQSFNEASFVSSL